MGVGDDSRRRGRRWAGVSLAVALLTAGAGVGAARASSKTAGWAIVRCGDTGGLISAIENADAGNGPSSILLAGGGCTYTLTQASATGNGPSGLPLITAKVTICGNGSSGVGGSSIVRSPTAAPFRFFEVTSGGSLSLSCQLTLQGGDLGTATAGSDGTSNTATGGVGGPGGAGSPGDDGGAIRVDAGGSLAVSSGSLVDNVAGTGGTGGQGGAGGLGGSGGAGGDGGAGGNGGAIYNAGSVTLTAVSLTGNQAGKGGAGGAAGTDALPVGTASAGLQGTNGVGGALYNDGGTVTINRKVTFSQNTPDNCAPTSIGC
jgi:hypothetical protein